MSNSLRSSVALTKLLNFSKLSLPARKCEGLCLKASICISIGCKRPTSSVYMYSRNVALLQNLYLLEILFEMIQPFHFQTCWQKFTPRH